MDKIFTAISTYEEALDYLYSRLPMFSRVGGAAYKPGLERVEQLDCILNHPHKKFKSIHIAGTNGKGSTSHMIASILQANGFKTALYTSPHLVDFRERMKINGEMIPEKNVLDFLNRWNSISKNCNIEPSFFELTMMMAFDWFAAEKVDYAVIEVGMGGRLDSTNIITPVACVITNISFDHTQFLGKTIKEIAMEKAGIIKHNIPVVIGESDSESEDVFKAKALKEDARIIFADKFDGVRDISSTSEWGWLVKLKNGINFQLPLGGEYQKRNMRTVLTLVEILKSLNISLDDKKTVRGLESVTNSTGLKGRWMRVNQTPLTICDTGHNQAGIEFISFQLYSLINSRRRQHPNSVLRLVLGFVADKDLDHIIPLLPKDAVYYLTQAAIPRALDIDSLFEKFKKNGFTVKGCWKEVKTAAATATADAAEDDVIFIGGSTFVVADFLK